LFVSVLNKKAGDGIEPDILKGLRVVSVLIKTLNRPRLSVPIETFVKLVDRATPLNDRSFVSFSALTDLILSDRHAPPAWLIKCVIEEWNRCNLSFLSLMIPIFGDGAVHEDIRNELGAAALSFADDAPAAAARAMDDLPARVIDGALRALSQGREIEAGHVLIEHFDDLFLAGEFSIAGRMLSMLDTRRLPPKVLSAVLMVSKHAKDDLGHARVEFFERVRAALSETWGLRPEQVESICRRHA